MQCQCGPIRARCSFAACMLFAACSGGEPTEPSADAGPGARDAAGEVSEPDDSDRNPSVGLPAETRLSELNPMQAMLVCEYAQRVRALAIGLVGAERITCTYRALAAPGVVEGMTVNQQACEAAVDACVAAAPPAAPAARSFNCAPPDLSPIWTSCDLAIGTLEGCMTQSFSQARAQYDAFSCEQLAHGRAAGNEPAEPSEEAIAACATVFTECPSLLDIAGLPWLSPGAD